MSQEFGASSSPFLAVASADRNSSDLAYQVRLDQIISNHALHDSSSVQKHDKATVSIDRWTLSPALRKERAHRKCPVLLQNDRTDCELKIHRCHRVLQPGGGPLRDTPADGLTSRPAELQALAGGADQLSPVTAGQPSGGERSRLHPACCQSADLDGACPSCAGSRRCGTCAVSCATGTSRTARRARHHGRPRPISEWVQRRAAHTRAK
jgi:hypothetical protein